MGPRAPSIAGLVAIAGATGFVGRHLAGRRLAAGSPSRCLVRDPARATQILPGAEVVRADLIDPASLKPALDGVATLVHCAAITADHKEAYPGQYQRVHVDGTRNLVRAAKAAGVTRVILMNGLGTRPAKRASYMQTRWEMGQAVQTSGMAWVALQPSVLFGNGAPFIHAFTRMARQFPVMPVLGGRLKLQPLWIEDLVTCLERAIADSRWDGRAIDLGGPEQLTFAEMVQLIMTAAHARRPTVPLPLPVARVQARLFSVLPNPPLVPATLELFDFDNITVPDVIAKEFGFQPRSVRMHLLEHGTDG